MQYHPKKFFSKIHTPTKDLVLDTNLKICCKSQKFDTATQPQVHDFGIDPPPPPPTPSTATLTPNTCLFVHIIFAPLPSKYFPMQAITLTMWKDLRHKVIFL